MHQQRVTTLLQHARAADLDCLAVIPGPNMVYFTGLDFHLSERPTIAFFPVEGQPVLLLPALEEAKGASSSLNFELFTYTDEIGPEGAFTRALGALDLPAARRLGVEGRRMRFLELDAMSQTIYAPVPVNADDVFAQLRMRKDAADLAAVRQAVKIAEDAWQATLPVIKAGVTEQDVAAELILQLLRHGSGEFPFAPIVAAGVNGANPHANAGSYVLQAGDLVTIDWGASANHYFSDITRTIAIAGADIPPRLERAYDAVLSANTQGRAIAKPNVTGQDVDRATRQIIANAGLDQYFIHRTGHGLGMETHEEPDMKEGSLMPLEPGMLFTVEPGVYIPDLGGIRIEDDVVITPDGAESLTTLPRELMYIG